VPAGEQWQHALKGLNGGACRRDEEEEWVLAEEEEEEERVQARALLRVLVWSEIKARLRLLAPPWWDTKIIYQITFSLHTVE